MDTAKRKKLEAAGFQIGQAADFLELTPEEAALIEARMALADALRASREAAGLTQAAVAKAIGSSQSRIAKAEAADASVSMDLILRAIFSTGVLPSQVLSRKVTRREALSRQRPTATSSAK